MSEDETDNTIPNNPERGTKKYTRSDKSPPSPQPPVKLDPIPVEDEAFPSDILRVHPDIGVPHSLPSNKYVILFGIEDRNIAKQYKESGAKVVHLSLSVSETDMITAQGLGLSIFQTTLNGVINPTLTNGNTALVVLGTYADIHASLEQRAVFAKSIGPVIQV